MLCTQPIDGGVGRHIGDLINGLSDAGWEISLCAPGVPESARRQVDHIDLEMGRAVAPAADLRALHLLSRAISEVSPDVVHAHSSKAGALSRVARIAHCDIPLVYTPHGYAFAGYFARSGERHVYRGIERSLAPLSTRVVCVCEAEARLARSVGAPERVRVVHNGVPPASDGPVDARIAELSGLGPVIGALTQLRPGKGLETLIDAMPHVLERHPRALVAICGDGPELDGLRSQTVERGVAHSIRFLGPTGDPMAVLRGIDVFVHPSWAEAFPYVVLEAMSVGLPVVASNVGGIGEALVDGESGLLVPSRDSRALATALIGLLDAPRVRVAMGDVARQRANDRFTVATMISRLIGVYDELVRSMPANRMGQPYKRPDNPDRSSPAIADPSAR